RGSRLSRFRQRQARHGAPDQVGRGQRSGGAQMRAGTNHQAVRGGARRICLPLVALAVALGASAAPLPLGFGEATAQVRTLGGQGGGQTVDLGLNKSIVIDLPRDAYDILVANPAVADAVTRTARRIYLFGK